MDFICEICGRKFPTKRNRANHSRWHNPEIRKKMIRGISLSKMGKKNPNWKGDKVQIGALHEWIKNHKLKPKYCEICKKNKPLDLANKSQKYKRDLNDYEWICRSCHMKKDGRLEKLTNYWKNRSD